MAILGPVCVCSATHVKKKGQFCRETCKLEKEIIYKNGDCESSWR